MSTAMAQTLADNVAPGNPGSQSALRQRNVHLVLEALRTGPLTQAEITRTTGLSAGTVSNIVKALIDDGRATTEPTTSSGRRALNIILTQRPGLALGIDFGRTHLRILLIDSSRTVLAERMRDLPDGHEAELGIQAATELIDAIITEQGINRDDILGAGVGIPGPIDRRSGTVANGAILPEWVGISITQRLETALGLPVFVDNDANLGALAEITWGEHAASEDLLFVKIGTGIGAGLITGGSIYYGNIGVTGEIGHAPIQDLGLPCRCGNRGCLETVASTATMLNILSTMPTPPRTPAELVERALNGHSPTLRVLEDAGIATGKILGFICNLLNPATVVVGGPLAPVGELLLEPVRRGITRHAVPLVGESTAVVMTSLGDRAEALGGAALALQRAGIHPH